MDSYRSAEALTVDDDLRALGLLVLPYPVQTGLRIQLQALFVRTARRETVASVLEHQNVAANLFLEDTGNGNAVSNGPCVAMKHQNGHIHASGLVGGPDEVGAQRLPVRRSNTEIIVIRDVELIRLRKTLWRSGSRWKIPWIDQFAVRERLIELMWLSKGNSLTFA